MLPLLLLLALAPQADDSLVIDGKVWRPLDGVVAQAGDSIVLKSELDRAARRLLERAGQSERSLSQAEYEDLLGTSLYREMLMRLEAQAGADLGLAATDVDRLVRAAQKDQRLGMGVGSFSDRLRSEGSDAIDWEEDQRRILYRRAWQANMLGRRGFGSERPSREAFSRPGKLFAIYRSQQEQLAKPEQVQFQEIMLPIQSDGPEATRQLLLDVRDDILAERVDYDTVAVQWNREEVRERKGLSELYQPEAFGNPEIRHFATTAEVGEISEPLPVEAPVEEAGEPTLLAYRLLKIVRRIPGEEPPPFTDSKLQGLLRERIVEQDEDRLLYLAQKRIFDRGYRWVQPGAPEPVAPPPRL